jgi:hypothetical protein
MTTIQPPPNLVHVALAELDPTVLISPDMKRVEVNLDAICRLIANPPPMIRAHMAKAF